MLSNSGHDERGMYSGGQAGDQGGEWTIIPWYRYPYGGWDMVLHYPDSNVRALIAKLATEAANNDNIGYDQSQRYTFWQQLQASGYRPANIKSPCEADCSAGVAAICKAVGYLTGNVGLQDISIYMYTGNERAVLTAAGFEVRNASKYLTGDSYLFAGDVLLNEENHTCICVTDGANATDGEGEGYKFRAPQITLGDKSVYVYRLQAILKARGIYGGALDSSYGNATRSAVIIAQEKLQLTRDGICGPNTWAKLLNLEYSGGYYIAKEIQMGSDRTDSILLAQEMLAAKGYYKGNLDKSFGPATRSAAILFQKDHGMAGDGIIGRNTWALLLQA